MSIDEFIVEPAYCRLYSYQNGNGRLSATVTGGAPDYTFLWENFETGEINDGGTYAGLNPGLYQLTVTDADGTTISETVTLDSLNVIADFQAYSDDLVEIPDGYIGFAPDTIGFVNLSENFGNPIIDPWSERRFFWNFNSQHDLWNITETSDTQYKGYFHGGEFEVCQVAQNKNGCKDTTCKVIGLFGSMLSTDESDHSNLFTIHSKSSTNEIIVSTSGSTAPLSISIYSLSGQLIQEEQILNSSTRILFSFHTGIYLYDFTDKNGQIISSGKFNY